MFADFVIPKNNENEFAEIAIKLGIKKLHFLYDFDNYDEGKMHEKLHGIENKKIGLIANQKNINKAPGQSKLIVVKSSDRDRFFAESKKVRVIYGFEECSKKDYIHQRASGLNHTLCELARKNNVAVGFSYSSLLNENSQTAALLIGRMTQNIQLCQKYKVKTVIGSFAENPFDLRPPHDVSSLFKLIGMDEKIIKNSLSYNF